MDQEPVAKEGIPIILSTYFLRFFSTLRGYQEKLNQSLAKNFAHVAWTMTSQLSDGVSK